MNYEIQLIKRIRGTSKNPPFFYVICLNDGHIKEQSRGELLELQNEVFLEVSISIPPGTLVKYSTENSYEIAIVSWGGKIRPLTDVKKANEQFYIRQVLQVISEMKGVLNVRMSQKKMRKLIKCLIA